MYFPYSSVHNHVGEALQQKVQLPAVFKSPIRQDIVHFVHTNLSKNSRQAHGVDPLAGMRHAAISWGPGRAVARVPRVTGSGSQRTGQAAFANMTRKGRMFAPLKTWRRWHRKVNINQRRYAICSALAASAVPALVLARGHRIESVPQIPLILDDDFETVDKTSKAKKVLETLGLWEDVQRCVDGRTVRAGKGKARGRRYKNRKGPLFILHDYKSKVELALRNIPGVDIAHVQALDIRQLAPGAHLGRLIVWTKKAFNMLDEIYGRAKPNQKFVLQQACLSNADVQHIISSNEIQSVLRPAKTVRCIHQKQKKNPFRNKNAMRAINPAFDKIHAQVARTGRENRNKKAKLRKQGKGISKSLNPYEKADKAQRRRTSVKWFSGVQARDFIVHE